MYEEIIKDELKDAFKRVIKAFRPRPNMFPDYFPYRRVKHWHFREHPTFEFPYNPALRDRVLANLEAVGWRVTSRKLVKGDDSFELEHDMQTMPITLEFNAAYKGSTCKRSIIGWETVTRDEPIYEVVCPEGEAEGVF